MAVLNDWFCKAHGKFESFDGACPYGCSGTAQKMISAPAILSSKTRFTSALTADLAARYSISDFEKTPGAGAGATWMDAKSAISNRSNEIQSMMPERMAEELAVGIGKIKPPDMREATQVIKDPENLQIPKAALKPIEAPKGLIAP